MEKRNPYKTKNDDFFEALKNAVSGIIYTTKTQRNFIIQLIMAAVVLIFCVLYKLNSIKFMFIIFAIFFVLFAEMINTSIEAVVDLYIDTYHPKAKIAKDVAAGAVTLASVNAVIIAYFIFIKEERLNLIFDYIIRQSKITPVQILFIVFAVIVLLMILINVIFKNKKIENKFIKSVNVLCVCLTIILIIILIYGLII